MTTSTYVRSSVRVKPDPAYYDRLYNRFVRQRNALLEKMGRNDAVQPERDDPADVRKLDSLCARVIWAMRMYTVAVGVRDVQQGRP